MIEGNSVFAICRAGAERISKIVPQLGEFPGNVGLRSRQPMTVWEMGVSPMQAPVQRNLPRLWLLLVVATVLAAPFVLFSTFNGMSWFDDEGTLLVGFRSLLDGH